jgi:hypothetical protein
MEEFHLVHDYYNMPREKGEGERGWKSTTYLVLTVFKNIPSFLPRRQGCRPR